MQDLAELFNAPEKIEFEGKTYLLREPTLVEAGEWSRWFQAEARASAARATELPEEDRRRLLRDVNADIAAQVYSWGSEACVIALRSPEALAQLMTIVCRDQGVTHALALRACKARLHEIARALLAAEQGDDPEKKALARQLLTSVGLPANFLSASWSPSSTSTDPPRSPPSATLPPDS
jgi:hypothetical protein